MKFRTSPETITSNPSTRLGRDDADATTGETGASASAARTVSTNDADGSHATIDAGSHVAQTLEVSAPVPQLLKS